MRLHSLTLAGMILLGVASAAAQDQEPRLEGFVQGGPSFFGSRTEALGPFLSVTHSFGVSGRVFTGVRYYFNGKDALETSYAYSANRVRIRQRLTCPPGFICLDDPLAPPSASARIHSVGFNYVRYFADAGRVRPFATGGVGFTVFDVETFNIQTSSGRELAGNFGGGLDFRAANAVSLRAELRDYVIEQSGFFSRGLTHNIVPSVGLAFRFGPSVPAALRPTKTEEERFPLEIFAEAGASWFSGRPSMSTHCIGSPTTPCFPFVFEQTTSFATTARFTVGIRYYLTNSDAVEASYSFTPTRLQTRLISTSNLFPLSVFSSTPMDVHNNSFSYVRYFSSEGRLAPFLTGGLGYSVYAGAFSTVTRFAGNFGGGVDIRLHRRVYLRGELRDFVTQRPELAFGGTTHNIVPSLGLAFRFR